MTDRTPTEQAIYCRDVVKAAHRKIRSAWDHAPDPAVASGRSDTGRITGGGSSDPTGHTAATIDRWRTNALAEVARLTIALGKALTGIDGNDRPGSIDYLTRQVHQRTPLTPKARRRDMANALALHRQWFLQLARHITELETDGHWDDARRLTFQLHQHTSAIRRAAGWIHGQLVRPPANPDDRVCDHPECQTALTAKCSHPDCHGADGCTRDLCDHHHARAERARQRREAEARADLTRPWCAQQIRACDQRVSASDAAAGARNCAACRKHKERHGPDQLTSAHPWQWHDAI